MKLFNQNHFKKSILLITAVSVFLTSCEAGADEIPGETQSEVGGISESDEPNHDRPDEPEIIPASDYSEFDLDTDAASDAVYIDFTNGTANIPGGNVELRDGALVISEAGDYVLSGEFSGQVIVNAGDDDNVQLIFSGFSVSADMAPVYIVNAKNASLTLAEGTENHISDSTEYSFDDDSDEPDSAVFSKCDLTINGEGSLSVNGNYACGIRSKDDLTIASGIIIVSAVKDGIKGRDSVVIRDGSITVAAGEDGIQSNNDEDTDRGYVIIEGGNIEISAGDDGIRSETWLQIYDGNITVKESYEGLEAAKIEIYGGKVDITASDDGINASSGSSDSLSAGNKRENGGMFGGFGWSDFFGGDAPEMPDAGMMPETPDRGEIPGFSADGTMPDEGMNRGFGGGRDKNMPDAGNMPDDQTMPEDGDRANKGGRGGMGGDRNFGGGMMNEMSEEGVYIMIADGTVRVKAGVDVIDSNGTFTQTGGTVITAGTSVSVYGSPEGVIDCNGSAVSEGGTFISLARSLGNNASDYNNLNGFVFYPDRNADFGAEMSITKADGERVIQFTPGEAGSVILVSSELFEEGTEYSVAFGETVFRYSCTDGITTIK